MKKFKLLLLDTNVVIKALELNLWQNLIERCDIWLADSVIQEAVFSLQRMMASSILSTSPRILMKTA